MKVMKKFLALLVSLTLVLSMCAFTTITASAETKYYENKMLIADDFEGYGTGSISAFKGQTGVDAAIGGEVVYDQTKGSNVLKLANKRYCVMFAGNATLNSVETIVMEFDFMAPDVNVSAPAPFSALVSLEGTNDASVSYMVNAGDGLRAPSTTSFTGADFAGKWYTAKAYHNVEACTTEWYAGPCGGELTYMGKHSKIEDKDRPYPTELTGRIDFYNPTELYVDNIRVYEGKPADGLTSLLAKAKAAKETAEAEITPAPVIYPEGAAEELGSAITEAENALSSATTIAEVNSITATLNTAYQNFLDKGTNKKSQVEIFDADFSEAGDFAGYQVLFTEGNSIVEKAVVGERDALKIQSIQTNYARFIKDLNALTYDKYVMKTSFRQDEKTAVHQVATVFSGSFNETNTIFEIYSDGTNLNIRYSDNKAGYASVNTMKSAPLVADYSVDVWYDIEVSFDMTDRTFMVKVDDNPVLTDRVLWFAGAGSTVNPAIIRAGAYALPGQSLYISEFSLVADESAAIVDAYKTVGEAIPVGTGAEYMRELPKTIGSYSVTYESADFKIADDSGISSDYVAYTNFKEVDYDGVLVAKTVINGTEYSFSYKLPVKAAYTGTVIDHNFNAEAGTAVNTIDSAYWTAEGAIATVTEGGVISLNGQRTLYSVPEAKRAASISVVSLKFMAPEDGITDIAGHIISISGKDGKGAIEVCLNDGNICISPGDYFDSSEFPGGYATMKAPILTDYEAGKWYDIKVLMNFGTRSYKVLVDGKATLNNRAITIAEPIRNIGRLSMKASSGKQIYLDDLKVYTTDFASVKGVDDMTIKQNERAEVSKVIYPSSYDSNGEMIADNYTFEIAGENTYGIRISKTGAIVVAPTAKAGEYTVTATSVYDPTKSVVTKLTVIGVDYAVTGFSITSGGAAVEKLENGMTLNAKAVLTKNNDSVKDNEIALFIAHYDGNGKLVNVKKTTADFTEKQSGATITATCDITLSGVDFTNHTVRAFLIYENVVYPVTGSISAF